MLCALCFVYLISTAIIPSVYACKQAYFGITWDKSVDLSNLSIQMCPSKYYMDSIVNGAMFDWNDISSNICVTRYTSASTGLESDDANINFHEEELTGTLAGLTHLYRKNLLGKYIEISDDELDSNYKVSQVRIGLYPNASTLEDKDRYRLIVHELGHALLLCHPKSIGCNINAIMQKTGSKIETRIITEHDKNNLIAKWGA